METKLHQMNPMATSKHWSDLRTDDDIQSAVSTFLENESHTLNGKTLHESIVEVSRWLGTQIQQEREGWAYKIRMAMQEIENHRRETLKINGVIHECTNQLRMIAECCNIDEKILVNISQEDIKRALPMYIECLAELINTLIEDRLKCLQLLSLKERDVDGQTVFNVLKLHLQRLDFNHDQILKEKDEHVMKLERENSKLNEDMIFLKKQMNKLQDEYEKIRKLLNVIHVENQPTEHVILPQIKEHASSPGDSPHMGSVMKEDINGIQITEEKLLKLQSSAKRLESSLQDALSQIDHFRRNGKMPKHSTQNQPSMSSNHNIKLKPLMRVKSPDVDSSKPSKQSTKIKYTQNSLHEKTKNDTHRSHKEKGGNSTLFEKTNNALPERSGRFQVRHLSSISDSKAIDFRDPEMRMKWRRRTVSPLSLDESSSSVKERSLPKMPVSQQSSKSFTFRSLVRSLDEMRARKTTKAKGGQKKVSKCLRCQKLFTLNDNHKKACCYHPRSKERVEEYTSKGRLTRVSYVWQCCQQGVDSQGCLYGQHV